MHLTPAIIAIERLAKLAMAGTQLVRMMSTAEAIVAGWRAEVITQQELRGRIEALHADVEAGLEPVEIYVSTPTPKGSVRVPGTKRPVFGP